MLATFPLGLMGGIGGARFAGGVITRRGGVAEPGPLVFVNEDVLQRNIEQVVQSAINFRRD